MTHDRIEKLKAIGFDWDPLETHWNSQFQLLCRFQQQHGHCLVPERYVVNGNRLGRWITLQRNEFRKRQEGKQSAISSERIAKLNGIGFEWYPLETQWSMLFDLLCQYKNEHGDCLVPKRFKVNGINLAGWVSLQRQDYRRRREGEASPMTDERIEQLNEIGFDWVPFETSWNFHYGLLERFQQEHGHCNVSKDVTVEGKPLHEWINWQRKNYRKLFKTGTSSLTNERIEKLNKIGFIWDPKETSWNKKLAVLCHFRKTHGHWRIPKNLLVDVVNLSAWLARQRIQFWRFKEGKSTTLTAERLRKLDEAGVQL